MAEFESTAIGATNNNYVGSGGGYVGGSSSVRFDLVTVSGWPVSIAPLRPRMGDFSFMNESLQFAVTGLPGYHDVVFTRTNLALGDWIPLVTNPAPFIFVDTNASQFPQRFYRAVGVR